MRQTGFAVEVSGGHVNNGDGLIATSNVTSTMFADRHTKSILSDDTTQENQNLVSREQSEVQHHHPVITEEITSTDREETHPESTALG